MRDHESKLKSRLLLALLAIGLVIGLGSLAVTANAATTFYFSSSTGSDSNPCTQTAPCQSLAKAEGLTLSPGDGVAFLRGDTWTGGLVIGQSGSSASRINFFGYGSGALARPKITGGKSGDCFKINGSFVTLDNLDARSCGYAGAEVFGSSITIQKSSFQSSNVGIRVAGGTSDVLIGGASSTYGNTIKNNTTPPENTSGPFGVLLNGPAIVSWNTISGQDVASNAYGRDGSAVEIYNASQAWVHHNKMIDNNAGVELGATGTGNGIEYNLITSDPATNGGDTAATGIVLPGSQTATWLSHNSVDLLGAGSQGIVCYSSCAANTQIKDSAVKALSKALYTDNGAIIVKNSVFNGAVQGITLDSSNSTATIGWVNPPTDLRETASSPTVDFGTVANLPVDLDGNPVPSGTAPDAGAYELQTTSTTPTPTPAPSSTPSDTTTPTPSVTPTPTPTPTASSHVLAAVGDTCSTSGTTQQCAKTAQTIAGFTPERFLHLGDFQYQNAGTNGATYKAGYETAFAGLHSKTIPTYGATHDTCDGSGAWECYPVSFMNSNGATEVRGKLTDHQWGYSVDIDNWHVVVFNYRTDQGGSVAAVTADLDAHPSQCLLAISHASTIGSPSNEHPTNEASAWRSTLVSHGVDLMLNGHQHFYERNLDPSGYTDITNGEGGIGHYSRTSTVSTSKAYNNTSYGPIKVVLSANGWTSDFVANSGATAFTDHASGGC